MKRTKEQKAVINFLNDLIKYHQSLANKVGYLLISRNINLEKEQEFYIKIESKLKKEMKI